MNFKFHKGNFYKLKNQPKYQAHKIKSIQLIRAIENYFYQCEWFECIYLSAQKDDNECNDEC